MIDIKKFLKPTDAWSTVFFADPVAIPFARFLARLRVHPNVITVVSYIPIGFAAYFFYIGDRTSLIYGGLLWQLALILDFTDGKVARINNTMTRLGRILDEGTEFPRNLIVFSSLLYSQFIIHGMPLIAFGVGIFLYHYGFHFLMHHVFKIREGFYMQDYAIPQSKRLRFFRRIGAAFTAEEEIFFMFVVFPIFGYPKAGIIIAHVLYAIFGLSLFYKKRFSI